MPNLIKDLLHFLHNDFPEDHEFSQVKATPVPPKSLRSHGYLEQAGKVHCWQQKKVAYRFWSVYE